MKSIMKWGMLIFLSVVFWSCRKENKPDAQNKRYVIKGNLSIRDIYTGSEYVLPNTMVYIRFDTSVNKDTSNYFYSTPTDRNGNFTFYIENVDLKYEIFASKTINSSTSFSANYYTSITTDNPYNANATYNMIATLAITNKNFLSLKTIDINGEIIPKANIILYSSEEASIKDISFSGVGSFIKFLSDSLGKAGISQLPSGKMYINSILQFNDTSNIKVTTFPIVISPNEIVNDTLILK